jgi:YVTN family beta-propeller protein
MKTKRRGLSELSRFLLLAVVASLPLVFGFKGCGGAGCSPGPCAGSGPSSTLLPCPPVPQTGSNPPGGFCTAAEDINSNGVTAPHLQATITGQWQSDLTNPVGTTESFSFNETTQTQLPIGWPQYVSGGRLNAVWSGTERWWNEPWCPGDESLQQWGGNSISGGITSNNATWPIFTCLNFTSTQQFFLVGALPSTITLQASGLTTGNGMPQLKVFNSNFTVVSTSNATSVAADGSSATFVFPTYQGNPLLAGEYSFVVSNQTSSGVFSSNAVGFFSIGTTATTYTTPFGIDLADYSSSYSYCFATSGSGATGVSTDISVGGYYCGNGTTASNAPTPAVTSFSNGTMSYLGVTYTVGSQPTAVKLFDVQTVTVKYTYSDGWEKDTTTGPLYAMTTNFASNTVSFVTLAGGSVSSIPVGTNPVTAVLDANQANAYVANYGSGSVSQINLTSFAQTRAIPVGASPSALAMDPSGTALWVGGLNYIEEISLSTYLPIKNFPVSGQVTSLAISQGENAIVYSAISSGGTLYQAANANLSSGATVVTYAQLSISSTDYTTAYALSTNSFLAPSLGSLPPYLISTGALVSASYGNRYVVMGTPTGFQLLDLETNTVMFSSATRGPVRGIATDPAAQMAYLTIPDSNTVISVPLPPAQP